jgi:heat shock protein HslJ
MQEALKHQPRHQHKPARQHLLMLQHLPIVFLLFASACTTGPAGANPAGSLPVPSQWKLVSLGTSEAGTPVIEGSSVTLSFDQNGQAGGNGGCNSFGGKFVVQGSALSIKEVVSTLRACADSRVTDQEATYLEALRTASRFEVTGDRLTIWYKDGQSKLNFVRVTT